MQIRIHNFVLMLLLGLMLLSLVLWSASLWFSVAEQNQHHVKLMRDSWQLQLDHLQRAQRLWLQQHFDEVSRWLSRQPDPQQRLEYMNQYSLQYPQIRLLHLLETRADRETPFLSGCYDSHGLQATEYHKLPDSRLLNCRFKQRPVQLISTVLNIAGSDQQLLMAIDYFTFLSQFEELSGRHFYLDKTSVAPDRYLEGGLQENELLMIFEFRQGLLHLGSLELSQPVSSFLQIWLYQLLWMLPAMLLITLLLYQRLYRALIKPLFVITERMKKVVRIQRPGNDYEYQYLAPGLMLLHRYFMHLTHIVRRDPLTGLNNRLIFEERLKHAILEGKRTGRRYALVLVDINSFFKV